MPKETTTSENDIVSEMVAGQPARCKVPAGNMRTYKAKQPPTANSSARFEGHQMRKGAMNIWTTIRLEVGSPLLPTLSVEVLEPQAETLLN
jgi:hypothetical protein